MEDHPELGPLDFYEPELDDGTCLSTVYLRVWATESKTGPEIVLYRKIIPLGEQKVAKKATTKKASTKAVSADDLENYLETDVVVLEPRLDIKVQDVIPKQYSSCGFSLSMRFMTRLQHSDKALKAAAIRLNNMTADVFDDLAKVFGGASPYDPAE